MTLSVAIIAKNNARTLRHVLESVQPIADEIIVVDSGSTDDTLQIARDFTTQVFHQDWLGFAGQKNKALSLCSGEWVLSLDSDEVLPLELQQEIRRKITSTQANAFKVNRKTHYLGRLLQFAWQPDFTLRLVRAAASPRWQGEFVHETLEVEGRVEKLTHALIHYSYANMQDHMQRTVRYAELGAQKLRARGKRFHWHKLLLNPAWGFFKGYILTGAFRDGFPGFVAGWSYGLAAFLKYLFLRDTC